jgi:hypothetical protein
LFSLSLLPGMNEPSVEEMLPSAELTGDGAGT